MPTAATAYSGPVLPGQPPTVDLTHQDDAGNEAGWDDLPGARSWGTEGADELLDARGWRRTAPWTYVADLAGVPGWTAPVERL